MIRMTLEESSKLLDEINVKRKNLEKLKDEEIVWYEKEVLSLEKAHQKMIAKLAKNSNILEDVLTYLNDKDKKITGEAFLIIVESQDREIIKIMIKEYIYNRQMRNKILSKIGYLSSEAFECFFYIMKEIGFEKTEAYSLITKRLLDYISVNHLTKYIDTFFEIESFSQDLQEDIIESLRYFEEFQPILKKLYKNRHSYFLRANDTYDIPLTLLLQKQDSLAFKILKNEDAIINISDTIPMLIRYSDKNDGKLIADTLIKAIRNKELIKYYELDEWLYQKINEIYTVATVSSPIFLKNSLEILLLSKDEDVGDLLATMIATQFGDKKISKKIKEIYNGHNEVNRKEVYNLLVNLNKNDMRKKDLYSGKLVDIKDLIFNSLAYRPTTIFARGSAYHDLVISTGQYFPLNLAGYYSTFKEHAEAWEEYLEKNKEKYEAGRWIRYGKYVD